MLWNKDVIELRPDKLMWFLAFSSSNNTISLESEGASRRLDRSQEEMEFKAQTFIGFPSQFVKHLGLGDKI